jgi:hypothetical protein
MDSHRTLRLPEKLDTAINQSNISFAPTVRNALKKQLLNEAVGICAVTGNICYQSNFATIGTTTPIGKHLNAPTTLDTIDVTNEVYETSSKEIAEGIPADEKEYTAEYVNDIGNQIYQAERLFFKTNTGNINEIHQPLVNLRYDDHPNQHPVDTRIYTVIQWIADTDIDTLNNDSVSTDMSKDEWITEIWSETPDVVKSTTIERIKNGDKKLREILTTHTSKDIPKIGQAV